MPVFADAPKIPNYPCNPKNALNPNGAWGDSWYDNMQKLESSEKIFGSNRKRAKGPGPEEVCGFKCHSKCRSLGGVGFGGEGQRSRGQIFREKIIERSVDEIVEISGVGKGKESQNLSTNAGNFDVTENNYREDSGILKFSSEVSEVGGNGRNGRKVRDLTLEICAKNPG